MRSSLRFLGLATLASFGLATQAYAVTLTSGSPSTTLAWVYTNIDGASINVLATFTLQSTSTTSAVLDVSVANNSTGAGQNALVSFGIKDITPNITAASVNNGAGTVTWATALNQSLTGNFKDLELCLYASNGCNGGSINGGLFEQQSDTFTLTLTGNFSGGSVAFGSPYASKFQGVGLGGKSYELAGCVQGEPNCVPVPDCRPGQCDVVPEPGTLALLGLGLLGLGLSRRKQNV